MNAEENHDKVVNRDDKCGCNKENSASQAQKPQEYLGEGISEGLRRKLEKYFNSHEEGNVPAGLYSRVINEIERVLFEVTLKYSAGNQSLAAKILGINRNTLRRKIQELYVSDFPK